MTNKKRPHINELRNTDGYRLIKTVNHDEVAHFVISELKTLRWPITIFYTIIIVLFFLIIQHTFHIFHTGKITFNEYWIFLAGGFIAGMILVIPFHELIHGLAYKLAGARFIKYGVDWKQALFYASAPGFVADKRSFYMVALAPFVIINLFFLSGIIFGNPQIQWALIVALFTHSTLCIGDFAMMNYIACYADKKLYTYDDAETNTSYFFVKL